MTKRTCDQCGKDLTNAYIFWHLITMNPVGATSMSTRPQGPLDFCSWRCVEDFARERAA